MKISHTRRTIMINFDQSCGEIYPGAADTWAEIPPPNLRTIWHCGDTRQESCVLIQTSWQLCCSFIRRMLFTQHIVTTNRLHMGSVKYFTNLSILVRFSSSLQKNVDLQDACIKSKSCLGMLAGVRQPHLGARYGPTRACAPFRLHSDAGRQLHLR